MTTQETMISRALYNAGFRMSYVADTLNMSMPTLYRKLSRPDTFKLSEALTLCKLLGVNNFEEMNHLFFANGGEKKSRTQSQADC